MNTASKLILSFLGLLMVSGTAWTMRPATHEAPVVRDEAARALVAPGVVEAVSDQAALGFEVAGRISEVLVNESDAVERGQLLARLDDTLARARVARAAAELEAAQARRDLTQAGAREEEIRGAV